MSVLDKLYNLGKTLNINDDNEEMCCCASTYLIRKLMDFCFKTNGEKSSKNIPLSKIHRLRKIATLTRLYGPMYLYLENYPTYSDKNFVIFETHINSNSRCIHGYTNCVARTDMITWLSKNSWEMLVFEFSQEK